MRLFQLDVSRHIDELLAEMCKSSAILQAMIEALGNQDTRLAEGAKREAQNTIRRVTHG